MGGRLHSSFHGHSREERGFDWLNDSDIATSFFHELEEWLLSLPIVCIASTIHRPGYVERCKDLYRDRLWLRCKTAYPVPIERAAKFAGRESRKLEVLLRAIRQEGGSKNIELRERTQSKWHAFLKRQRRMPTIRSKQRFPAGCIGGSPAMRDDGSHFSWQILCSIALQKRVAVQKIDRMRSS